MLERTVEAQRNRGCVLGFSLAYLTSEGTLIGEEIYAVEAYLARSPAPLARLLTPVYFLCFTPSLVCTGLRGVK